MTPDNPHELYKSENLMVLITSETHSGYSLKRTESFGDLVRTGLALIPDGFRRDEED